MAVSGDVIATAYVQIQALTDKFNAQAAAKIKPGLTDMEHAAAKSGQTAGDHISKGVGGGATSAAKHLFEALGNSGAFAPLISQVSEIADKFEGMGEHGNRAAKILMGAGAAVTGVGGVLALAASKDEAAMGQLQATVTAVGGNWDEFKDKVETAAKGQERYGYTANQTADALDTLTQATHDPQQALDRLQLVTDLAARKHMDLNSAATLVAKAMGGNARLFKQFGIEVGTATDGTKNINGALNQLATQLTGQAAAAANTFTGHLHALAAEGEDVVASLGTKIGGVLTAVGPAMLGVGAIAESGLGAKLGNLFRTAEGGGKSLGGLATNLRSGLGSALSGLMSPLGLATVGIGAIGAGFAYAWEQDEKANAALKEYAKTLAEDLDPSKLETLSAVQAQYNQEIGVLNGNMGGLQDTIQKGAVDSAVALQKQLSWIPQEKVGVIQVKDSWDALTAGQYDNFQKLGALKDRRDELSKQDQQIIDNVSNLTRTYGLNDRAAIGLASTYGIDLKGSADDVTQKFAAMRLESEQASRPLDATDQAAVQLASGFGDAAARGQELQTVLDGLAGKTISAREAHLAEAKAVDALTASFAKNGTDLRFNTAAGQANNEALDHLAQTTIQTTTAQFALTGKIGDATAAWDAGVASLDKAAGAAGMNQQQIAALNQSLGLTPGALQQIIDKASATATALDNIPNHVNVEVHYDTTGTIATGSRVTGSASGGLVTPGGGTWPPPASDTVLRWLTPGEFVVTPNGSNLGDAVSHFMHATPAGAAPAGAGMGAIGALLAQISRKLDYLPHVGADLGSNLNGVATRAKNLNHQRPR